MFYRPLKVTIHSEVAYYERINFTIGDSGTLLAFDFQYKFNLSTLVGCNFDLTFKAPNGSTVVVPSIIRSDIEPTQIAIPEVVMQNPGSVFVEMSLRAEGKKITMPTRLEYIVRDVMLDNPTTEPIYEILVDKAIDEVNRVINNGFEIISNAVEVAKVEMQYFLETELDAEIAEKFEGVIDANLLAINTAKDSSITQIQDTSSNSNNTLQAIADEIVDAASFFDSTYTHDLIEEFKVSVNKIIDTSNTTITNNITTALSALDTKADGIVDSFNKEVDRCVTTVNTTSSNAISQMVIERDVAISKVNTTCALAIDKAEKSVIEMIKRADTECDRVSDTGTEQNALLLQNAQKFNTELSTLRDNCIQAINNTFTEKNELLTTNATAHLTAMQEKLTASLADVETARLAALEDISNAGSGNLGDISTALTNAINTLNTRKDEIVLELNNLKDSIINILNSAKDSHVSTMLTAKNAHITAINTAKDDSITAIGNKETQSITNINTKETSVLSNIDAKKDNVIKTVSDRETLAITNINTKETQSITAVGTKEDSAIVNLQAQETGSINTITETKVAGVKALNDTKDANVVIINKAKDDSITAIGNKEAHSITNINTKELSSIKNVADREALAITNITNKENQVLEDIGTTTTIAISDINNAKTSSVGVVGDKETESITALNSRKNEIINEIDTEFFNKYETETTAAMSNMLTVKDSSNNSIIETKNAAIDAINTAVEGVVEILSKIDEPILQDTVNKVLLEISTTINTAKQDIETHMENTYVPAKSTLDTLLITVGERNTIILDNTATGIANITNTKTTAEAAITKKVNDEVIRLDSEVFGRYDESALMLNETHTSILTQLTEKQTTAEQSLNAILENIVNASTELQANLDSFKLSCAKIVDDEIARLNVHIESTRTKEV